MTLFAADLGWLLMSPLQLLGKQNKNAVLRIRNFNSDQVNSFKSTIFAQRLAQAQQLTYNSKRYTSLLYKIGSEVHLTKNIVFRSVFGSETVGETSNAKSRSFQGHGNSSAAVWSESQSPVVFQFIESFTLSTLCRRINYERT